MLEVACDNRYVSIDCRSKIYIDLDGLVLNGIDYSEGDYLEIYQIDDIMGVHIGCDGKIERAYLSNAKSNIRA